MNYLIRVLSWLHWEHFSSHGTSGIVVDICNGIVVGIGGNVVV